jgi:hypothetical protein
LEALAGRAVGDYWLVEGPKVAVALCAALRRDDLPPPPQEADDLLVRLSGSYCAELAAAGVADIDLSTPLSPLSLGRLLVTDAAQGVLPAPLWLPLYAMGGGYQQVAALLLVTDVLTEAVAQDPAPSALVDLLDCVAYDLVGLVCSTDLDAAGLDRQTQETLQGLADLLSRCAVLAELCALVVEGCRSLADVVEDTSGCEDCAVALTMVGEPALDLEDPDFEDPDFEDPDLEDPDFEDPGGGLDDCVPDGGLGDAGRPDAAPGAGLC